MEIKDKEALFRYLVLSGSCIKLDSQVAPPVLIVEVRTKADVVVFPSLDQTHN